nr:butyrophilin subfamily 3 member A2-like [Chelonoidis abingdonii]
MKVLSFCPSAAVSISLPDFIIFFIIYHIHKLESAQFSVTGPGHPVTAIVGEAIVLPCHLSPRMSAENMEVRWFRSEFLSFVHLYQHGKDQYGNQMPDYRGRTELLKAGITDGNVSLQILNIRHSDEGQYNCFVQDGSVYEEAPLELKIAALGSNPLISVESHQDGGIRVVCRSAGWYPEPKVLWRDHSGQELPSLSEAKSLGDSDLFETENSIIIKERSNQNLSCWIRNTVLNQEKESTVYVADFFFPRVNPWMVALSVILPVLFGFIGFTVYLCKIKGKHLGQINDFQRELDWRRNIICPGLGSSAPPVQEAPQRILHPGAAPGTSEGNRIEKKRQQMVADFQQLHQFLEEQEWLLLAQLEKLEKEIRKIQNENITKLSEEISRLNELISELEGKCQEETRVYL